jgi:PAS domain S-box-containing protein
MSQSAIEAVVHKSLDGRITSWTASAAAMFGYTGEQARGKHISIIIPFDYQDEEYDILDRIKNGAKRVECETVRRCREGLLIRVRMTAVPVQGAGGKLTEIKITYRLLDETSEVAARMKGIEAAE